MPLCFINKRMDFFCIGSDESTCQTILSLKVLRNGYNDVFQDHACSFENMKGYREQRLSI